MFPLMAGPYKYFGDSSSYVMTWFFKNQICNIILHIKIKVIASNKITGNFQLLLQKNFITRLTL